MSSKSLVQKEPANTQVSIYQQQVDHSNKMIEMAINKDVDIDKLDRLLQMQKQMKEDIAREQFFENLSKFQSEVPTIKKKKEAAFDTRSGGKMSYKYASLEDITETIKPYLQKYGISYRFEQRLESGMIIVSCHVTCCGHTEVTEFPAPADTSGNKNIIQQSASTVTYLRRYTLTGALGITTADEDIDGRLPEQKGHIEFYDEELFNRNLPQWTRLIQSGKKSAQSIVTFIEAKGGALTDEQINALNQVQEQAEQTKQESNNESD